ncbi:DUF2867 domain-containing protein [Bradyrhizobium pachyrhizi]|uniref:DUF2867 domain-containing protein n=1 Tax=Bradyrhizobium pachyrhizi TaxID=280333 RepID=UPI003D35B3E6
MMSRIYPKVEPADLPPASRLNSSFGRADFADAFSVDLPEGASGDAEVLTRHVFEHQPAWIAMLLGIRACFVRPFGLKRAADLRAGGGDRISIFRVFDRHQDEVILGEDDRASRFYVSVLLQPASEGQPGRLIVSTLVFYNCRLGRAYIALIAPFHRLAVRALLDRAQKRGTPALLKDAAPFLARNQKQRDMTGVPGTSILSSSSAIWGIGLIMR